MSIRVPHRLHLNKFWRRQPIIIFHGQSWTTPKGLSISFDEPNPIDANLGNECIVTQFYFTQYPNQYFLSSLHYAYRGVSDEDQIGWSGGLWAAATFAIFATLIGSIVVRTLFSACFFALPHSRILAMAACLALASVLELLAVVVPRSIDACAGNSFCHKDRLRMETGGNCAIFASIFYFIGFLVTMQYYGDVRTTYVERGKAKRRESSSDEREVDQPSLKRHSANVERHDSEEEEEIDIEASPRPS